MVENESNADKASPVIAILAMVVFGGILAVPISLIMYRASGGLGGLILLGALIVCQAAAFALGKLAFGGIAAIVSLIDRMHVKTRK